MDYLPLITTGLPIRADMLLLRNRVYPTTWGRNRPTARNRATAEMPAVSSRRVRPRQIEKIIHGETVHSFSGSGFRNYDRLPLFC